MLQLDLLVVLVWKAACHHTEVPEEPAPLLALLLPRLSPETWTSLVTNACRLAQNMLNATASGLPIGKSCVPCVCSSTLRGSMHACGNMSSSCGAGQDVYLTLGIPCTGGTPARLAAFTAVLAVASSQLQLAQLAVKGALLQFLIRWGVRSLQVNLLHTGALRHHVLINLRRRTADTDGSYKILPLPRTP